MTKENFQIKSTLYKDSLYQMFAPSNQCYGKHFF